MAWTTPTNPVAGTVITVAYAVTNFVNNLIHLRALTGNADPPGSDYTIRSTSTSATDWSKVTTDMIETSAVTNDKILDNTINAAAKLADGSVTALNMSPNSVDTSELVNQSVTNDKILDDTINLTAKAADGSLTADKVANKTLTQATLGLLSVGTPELQAGAVTHEKMTITAPLSSIQGPPLTLTTSNGDLAQITCVTAGTYLVHAHVLLYTTTTAGDTNQNLTSWINAPSGIVGTLFRHYTGPTAVDQNTVQAQSQLIALTAGQQVTLRAKKSGGTGNSGASDGTLIAEWVSA